MIDETNKTPPPETAPGDKGQIKATPQVPIPKPDPKLQMRLIESIQPARIEIPQSDPSLKHLIQLNEKKAPEKGSPEGE